MFGFVPLPRTLEAALRDAAHAQPRVRISAISDLARWATTEARARCLETLVALLRHDGDEEVRAAAALALADSDASDAASALQEAALSDSPRVVQMALLALGEVGTPGRESACRVVEKSLQSEAPALRFQALVAANRLLSRERILQPLLQALCACEARVRYLACRVCEERFSLGDAERAGSTPAGIDPEDVARLWQAVDRLLDDEDPEVTLAAAVALGRRGCQRATDRLVRCVNARRRWRHLDDEQAAIDLCADLGLRAAVPGLRARAWGRWWSGPSAAAFQARVALARLGDSRARGHLLRGLSSWNRRVRSQSVVAVGQAKLFAARARLRSMQGDARRADPDAVDEALRTLGD